MAAFIVIVWTLIGFCAGAVLVGEIGSWLGTSGDRAGAGMSALVVGGPVGALFGVLLGFSLNATAGDGLRKKRMVALGSLAALIGIPLGIWAFETWRTYDHLTTRPNTFGLSFQVRLPAGKPTPAGAGIGIELRSAKENPRCKVYDYPHGLREEGGHFVVSGQCDIFYATPKRRVLVRIGDEPTLVYTIRYGAR